MTFPGPKPGPPIDWADPLSGPENFFLPRDWDKLVARYAGLEPSAPLTSIYNLVREHRADQVLLEREYIDEDFRDEYIHFYAGTYRPISDRCERLHFFRRGKYLGYSVLRPIQQRPVCRTLVSPPPSLRRYVSCVAQARARPYGREHRPTGFPFISQDFQYSRCAHAAVWMVALYFHLRFRAPRVHISDIVGATAGERPELPAPGLSPDDIAIALRRIGMQSVVYDLTRRLPRGQHTLSMVRRYLESGLPVILGTSDPDHATVLIGYGMTRAKEPKSFFVRSNDAVGPYERFVPTTAKVKASTGNEFLSFVGWEALIMPLPGRVYLPGDVAEFHAETVLVPELLARRELAEYARAFMDGRLRLRSYLTESGAYKVRLAARGLAPGTVASHRRAGASHWIWVTELQDRSAAMKGRRCVVGELAMDATSDELNPLALFGNLPGVAMTWPHGHGQMLTRKVDPGDEPYTTGTALHVPPLAPKRPGDSAPAPKS